jgi:hypothetical protein
MEGTTMTKKIYMQPVTKVIELQHKSQILAGSVTSVTTTGLGDGLSDDLILPDGEEPKSGSVWEDAY